MKKITFIAILLLCICRECKIKGNFRLKGIRSTNPIAVSQGESAAGAFHDQTGS